MNLRIHNLTALMTSRRLAESGRAISSALQRLASGQRVNSPQDDAAAYSVGVNLQAQIRGLAQTSRNLNDALALTQVATSVDFTANGDRPANERNCAGG